MEPEPEVKQPSQQHFLQISSAENLYSTRSQNTISSEDHGSNYDTPGTLKITSAEAMVSTENSNNAAKTLVSLETCIPRHEIQEIPNARTITTPENSSLSDAPRDHSTSIGTLKSSENQISVSEVSEPPNEINESIRDPGISENHLDPDEQPTKKRRRRKKQFPEMIPSTVAVNGLRVLRPQSKSNIYNEKLMDNIIRMQIDDVDPPSSKNRRRKFQELSREIDVEALIALAVGFPVDSLMEEEIEYNVVPVVGGVEQANYIVVRNHILALWRSNVSSWLTKEHAMKSIRTEHRGLVNIAYDFLMEYGFINFGLAPAIKEVQWKPMESSEKPNVLIIGAGLSGLAAARHLLSLGFKVMVLEGRNRPGGRVVTKKMEGGGVIAAADLGGSVLTGINGNPFGVLARQLGFPLHKVRDKCPLYLPNGNAVNDEVDSRVEALFNRLLDKVCKLRQTMMDEMDCVDVSLGTALEAFRSVFKVAEVHEERMLLNWHLANLEYANASLLSDLSLAFWDQDDPYEMGGDHCFIPGGNGRFIRALAENVPIFYGKVVNCIQYGIDGVRVITNNGQVFSADMVLCTVSLGVLKRGLIQFVPKLPQTKEEAIQRLGFGLLNKVAMLFPYDFWGGEIDTFGHLTKETHKRGEFFLFYSYVSVSGGPLLIALVAGASAIEFETMSPIESTNRVLDVLKGIFAPKGVEVPDPIQVVCTRWGVDKFTYGSYSHVAIGASGDDYDILAESVGDGRVFFAGEATNRRYPATMHGAFLSGLREAANILRVAKKRFSSFADKDIVSTVKDKTDLVNLFHLPDMSFGNFSVLFDPTSSDLDANALVQVGFKGNKLGSDTVFLYCLVLRKQAMELSSIKDDQNRLKLLQQRSGAKLVGSNGLCSVCESLIGRLKASRVKSQTLD